MTDTPSPHLPTAAEAAALLVEASAIDVDTDRGETIEIWTIASDGDTVTGSGPRLAGRRRHEVTCRLSHDGQPIQVDAVIEEAEFRSQARASLVLRIVAVSAHGYRRRAERLAVSSAASLRARHLRPGRARRGHPRDADRPERRRLRDEPHRQPPARAAIAWRSRPGSSRASSPPTCASSASTRPAPTSTPPAATSSARTRRRAGRARARARPARGARAGPRPTWARFAMDLGEAAAKSLKSRAPAVPMRHIGRLPSVPLHAFLRPDERSEPTARRGTPHVPARNRTPRQDRELPPPTAAAAAAAARRWSSSR